MPRSACAKIVLHNFRTKKQTISPVIKFMVSLIYTFFISKCFIKFQIQFLLLLFLLYFQNQTVALILTVNSLNFISFHVLLHVLKCVLIY
ncbi:MAG TPA: hypothetical protein DEH02_13970 [Bacteroidales bacterium]|nr:hypothetical protein [Bacteroidales bacterium]